MTMTIRDEPPQRATSDTATLPRIALPPLVPPTREEIERRRVLYDRVRRRRAEIGPIGIRSDELIHQAREDSDRPRRLIPDA